MKIYQINWVQSGAYSLSAVVIAENESAALEELDLDESYNADITATIIGAASPNESKQRTVCHESL
jgi:hypothetical protein